jgi:hypothetical protein
LFLGHMLAVAIGYSRYIPPLSSIALVTLDFPYLVWLASWVLAGKLYFFSKRLQNYSSVQKLTLPIPVKVDR